MRKIYYNKLIRDKVPEKIRRDKGAKYRTRVLSKLEFERELLRKVEEEVSAIPSAKNKVDLISEIADVIDVLEEVQKLKKISAQDIKKARARNMKIKGGFKKRLFLFWSQDTGYATNEVKRKPLGRNKRGKV
jgi:predicted house-cleaning noncanonical NTP pyrophosphatase (MazG superfamily)